MNYDTPSFKKKKRIMIHLFKLMNTNMTDQKIY